MFGPSQIDPAAGSKLVKDIYDAAEWAAKALTRAGYPADFSVESVHELERFFSASVSDGQLKQHGLLTGSVGSTVFALGSYLGEVIRRKAGGRWVGDDTQEGELVVRLEFNRGDYIWPIIRVMKRIANGPEDNVEHYARIILRDFTLLGRIRRFLGRRV